MPGTHITVVVSASSFWLTVGLAAAGSALSAVCIYDPVSEPKRDPYFFMGQWFIWLATPLLWGAVALSAALGWLKPFDLLLALLLAGACRYATQVVCNRKWRNRRPPRVRSAVYVTRPSGTHERPSMY